MTNLFSLEILIVLAISVALIEGILYVLRQNRFRSARKFLRQAKKEVEQLAQLPLNNPYPLIQLSRAGTIIFANPATYDMFPDLQTYKADHPALRDLQNIIDRIEAGLTNKFIREITIGDAVYHQTFIGTQGMGQGDIILYCQDVTELADTRDKLEKSRKEAEAANQAKSDFLANMSHELRTPMNGIIGLSDILSEADIPPEYKELAQAVSASSRNLLTLLNDILDFSKIEAGELTLEEICYDTRALLKQTENIYKTVASQKGLNFHAQLSPDVPPYLTGDPVRTQQIINNLLSNAIKFTEEGCVSIILGGERSGKNGYYLSITISDTGVGIPPEKQKSIFEKFSQADISTARKYGGTGLGLAITQNLVDLMHGEITMDSIPGKGSSFTVTLPLQTGKPENALTFKTAAPITTDPAINKTGRILIVDDHPVNLLFLRTVLHNFGLKNFDEATGGEAALKLLSANTYDIVFLDCQMPDIDGFEVARTLRGMEKEQDRRTPLIALTADAMKGAAEQCLAAGMDDYVSKPVDKARITSLLEKYLPTASVNLPPHSAMSEKKERNEPMIFDFRRIKEFARDDRGLEELFLTTFLDNAQRDMADLDAALQHNDFKKWLACVHKLFGSASNIGANALADICDSYQDLSNKNDVPMAHAQIVKCYQETHSFLRAHSGVT